MKHPFENHKRIARDFTMHVSATPDKVFPLLCPVREYDWIETWKCEMINSRSGFAELDCVFKTRHGEVEDLWTVSRYEPNEMIEFVVSSAFRIIRYRFSLSPDGADKAAVFIEQVVTALNANGESSIEEPEFTLHMKILEAMLNHFLVTGEMISNREALKLAGSHPA